MHHNTRYRLNVTNEPILLFPEQYTDQLIPYPSQHSPPTSPLQGNTKQCAVLCVSGNKSVNYTFLQKGKT